MQQASEKSKRNQRTLFCRLEGSLVLIAFPALAVELLVPRLTLNELV
jgi:hypothetical protein